MLTQHYQTKPSMIATASSHAPSLLEQVGMAGGSAVITVSFIHPIDVIKVSDGFTVVIFTIVSERVASEQNSK